MKTTEVHEASKNMQSQPIKVTDSFTFFTATSLSPPPPQHREGISKIQVSCKNAVFPATAGI